MLKVAEGEERRGLKSNMKHSFMIYEMEQKVRRRFPRGVPLV